MHFPVSYTHLWRRLLALLLVIIVGASPAFAQEQPSSSAPPPTLTLTLDEALQLALIHNFTLQKARLDVENARSQVAEGWGELMPQLDINSTFTRNFISANPFAGSQAGDFFSGLGFINWLTYNEQARTDGNPATAPIPVDEFFRLQMEGMQAAGIDPTTPSNPFEVPNQFANGLSLSQVLFDGRAIWGASGAKKFLEPFNQRGYDRQEQLLLGEVKQQFYQALLVQEQVQVAIQSAARSSQTLNEVSRQVSQGVAPKFQRLSAEVELANIETVLVQAENLASLATENLKLSIGIPMTQPIRLRGALQAEELGMMVSLTPEDAAVLALNQRPDLDQARLNVELQKVQKNATRAEFFPTLNLFANLNYVGSVPNDRVITISTPDDPFKFTTRSNSFFSDSYWDWAFNVGLSMRWNIFNGFRSKQRMQQRKIAISQAELDYEFMQQSIRLEVEQALRDLSSAQQRMQSQGRNVERAELNYTYADARLREGVANPLEVREASEQLDQSRLNHLQAIHDFLVARSAFETAVGMTPQLSSSDTQLTSN